MPSDVDWEQAACRQPGADPDLWHDAKDIAPPGGAHRPSEAAVKCMTQCPARLRDACLRQAMNDEGDAGRDSRYGVFGGADPLQRYELWKLLHPERAAAAEERSARIAAARAREYERRRAGPAAA